MPKTRARIQLHDYSVTTQGIENIQVFKSENTLTGCKIPNFIQSRKKDILGVESRDGSSETIEWKLLQYSKQACGKTYDPTKNMSEADKRFRQYIEN